MSEDHKFILELSKKELLYLMTLAAIGDAFVEGADTSETATFIAAGVLLAKVSPDARSVVRQQLHAQAIIAQHVV